MAAKVSFETDFLRAFAGTYVSEIAFTEKALDDIRWCRRIGRRIGLADVLFVLKTGDVVTNEKEQADGAEWQVEGNTCDGDGLFITLEVWCDRYHVRVQRIRMLIGVTNV